MLRRAGEADHAPNVYWPHPKHIAAAGGVRNMAGVLGRLLGSALLTVALFAFYVPGARAAFSVANNGGLPAGAPLYSQLDVKVYLTGFAELSNGCDFNSLGSWQVIQPPQHGRIDFATVQSYYFGPS